MNLYDPTRPKISSGLPALLNGGPYIVPQVNAYPLANDKVELRIFVPVMSVSGFVYSSRRTEIFTKDLPEFFDTYRSDPELALRDYFRWEMPAQLPPRAAKPTAPPPDPLYAQQESLI